jgi:L-ascorbate metabolism protein UlaG (beta-lactamase superfamily)
MKTTIGKERAAARLFLIAALPLCLAIAPRHLFGQAPDTSMIEAKARQAVWFGQSAFMLPMAGKNVFIDPLGIKGENKADIILITHNHGDHFSMTDIKKIATDSTRIYAPAQCGAVLSSNLSNPVTVVEPGWSGTDGTIGLKAVPAYNNNHPMASKYVGYLITADSVTFYHAGDTKRIPEMQTFECDVAMLPLGQTYTMGSVAEAADAALDVKAKVAVPMHYGMAEGKASDAALFDSLLHGRIRVVVPVKFAPSAVGSRERAPRSEALTVRSYPNPFNGVMRLAVDLKKEGRMNVSVFTSAGRRVAGLADGRFSAGSHEFCLDAGRIGIPSGAYIVRASADGEVRTLKAVYLK